MQPDNQNPYDFILDSSQPPKKSLLPNSQNNKIIMTIALVVVVLLLLIGGFSLISSLTKPNSESLADLAAQQTELIRIADKGAADAQSLDAKQRAQTLLSFMRTDLSTTNSLLAELKAPLSEVTAVKYLDTKADTALVEAAQSNQYDAVLLEILDKKIATYKRALQDGLNSATSAKRTALYEQAAKNIITYEQ